MPLPGTGRSVQRCAGFSLVETVLAGALFAVIALVALEALRQLEGATRHLAARHTALTAIERLDATLRAEARSAIAIWSASSAAGEGADGCVELDFAAVDAGGPSFWSYRAFPRHGAGDAVPADALERVAARGPLAPCDPALHGAVVLRGLRAPLSVQSILPQNVAAHADPYLAVPDSPYVGASVPAVAPAALPLRDARGAALTGGNVLIEARFDTDAGSRVVDLLPGTLPTGFSEELHYTCSERCDVGHDSDGPKTLTRCAAGMATAPSGTVFTFTYSGTRAADGGTDTLVRSVTASEADVAHGSATLDAERVRCAAVQRAGEDGSFYANG